MFCGFSDSDIDSEALVIKETYVMRMIFYFLIIMVFVRANILDVDKRVRSFAQRARTMCFSLDASPSPMC